MEKKRWENYLRTIWNFTMRHSSDLEKIDENQCGSVSITDRFPSIHWQPHLPSHCLVMTVGSKGGWSSEEGYTCSPVLLHKPSRFWFFLLSETLCIAAPLNHTHTLIYTPDITDFTQCPSSKSIFKFYFLPPSGNHLRIGLVLWFSHGHVVWFVTLWQNRLIWKWKQIVSFPADDKSQMLAGVCGFSSPM